MDAYEPLLSLLVAGLVGLLIGLEREQSRPIGPEAPGHIGGIRTHPLVALSGALTMLLSRELGVWLPIAGLLTVGALVIAAYVNALKAGGGSGITSEVTLIVTYLLGTLAMSDVILPVERRWIVVASLAVLATLLLSVKPTLHAFAKQATRDDILATLKFLIVAVVVLPLLPDRTYGPLDVLNPYSIGLMVVLIAGIGFVGYLLVRALGPGRGLGLTGLVGGLVSSTAVTLSSAGRAKGEPAIRDACALAVTVASTVMFGRILLEVQVVHPDLVPRLAVPLVLMTLAGAAFALVYFLRGRAQHATAKEVRFSNPFELSSALKFGALFAGILLVSKAATLYLGAGGTYLAGLLAGLADVDAITLSMARLAKAGEVKPEVAVTTILIGAGSNTVVKGTMATVVGGWDFGRRIALAFGTVLLAGLLGVLWVWLS